MAEHRRPRKRMTHGIPGPQNTRSRLRLLSRSLLDAPAAPCAARLHPPEPPLKLTPLVACDRETPMNVLWNIARQAPELRRWIVANPRADAALLEYIAQAGGPGVTEAIETLLDSLESGKHED